MTRARDPGEADDLAGRGAQPDRLEAPRDGHVLQAHAGPASPRQRRLRPRRARRRQRPGRGRGGRAVTEHRVDDRARRQLRPRHAGERGAAVAQHRDLVAHREDLLEDVRDEHDRDAALAQDAQHAQQRVRVGALERRGRLVEDQHARPGDQRPRDLDELALGERQGADRPAQGHVEAEVGEDRPRAGGHLAPAHERPAARLAHREQVGQDVEVLEQAELLGDDRDAVAGGVRGARERHRAAVEAHRPGVGAHRARDDLHERRLPGAVLADEGVDRAGPHAQARAVERADAAVRLRDALGLEHGRAGGGAYPPGSGRRWADGLPSCSSTVAR